MKKNQKYTQEEMYLAIDIWKESGLLQQQYSRQNGIAYNTFKYWDKEIRILNIINTHRHPKKRHNI